MRLFFDIDEEGDVIGRISSYSVWRDAKTGHARGVPHACAPAQKHLRAEVGANLLPPT